MTTPDTLPEDMRSKRPARSRSARRPLVWGLNLLLSSVFLVALLFAGAFWYGSQRFDAPGPLVEETTYDVPAGASFRSIAPALAERGIIENPGPLRIFSRGVRAAGKEKALKVGEFAFAPGMSMRQVMNVLTEGRPIQYSLSFPEGLTSYQMVERITFSPDMTGTVETIPEEGTLKPDTYLFPRGFDRQKLIGIMQAAQTKALDAAWESRDPDLPLADKNAMLTLASIVEKETGVASERPEVAGVFVNRLRKGMRLQTDPTIIYGLFGGKGKPSDRPIYKSDIEKPTPYNTYTIDGLPPGPIANPGEASLKAVAAPANTTAVYFVADGSGGHAFAETLDEHNANVRKWRAIEAEREKALGEAADEIRDTATGDGN